MRSLTPVSTNKTRKKLIFFFLSVCAMIFKSIRFFSFGKVILSCVCTHTHNQNKRQSFTLYIYSVEYIIIWRDWMMLILKYFHITEMYFLFSPFQGMTNSSVQFSFLDVGTPFFFFSLGVFLGNIHNTYNQTRAAAYRSRQHSMRKKEIRRIKMNRPGRRRKKRWWFPTIVFNFGRKRVVILFGILLLGLVGR